MPRAPMSQADAELLSELSRRGCPEVTRYRLERWRQRGMLPRPVITGTAGRGTIATLPPDSVEIAEILAHNVYRGGDWHVGVIALYEHGFLSSESAMRETAVLLVDRAQNLVSRSIPVNSGADPLEAVEQVINLSRHSPGVAAELRAISLQIRNRYPFLARKDLADEARSILTWQIAARLDSIGDDPDDDAMRARALGWLNLDEALQNGWSNEQRIPTYDEQRATSATLTSAEMWLLRKIYEHAYEQGQYWVAESQLFRAAATDIAIMRHESHGHYALPLSGEYMRTWWQAIDASPSDQSAPKNL